MGASAKNVLQTGASRARGAMKTLACQARTRAGLLTLPTGVAPPHQSDGIVCEGCGVVFGLFRRRKLCTSCDRYFCASCLGSPLSAVGLHIVCLCTAVCPQCADLSQRSHEFELRRAEMESGVSVVVTLPEKNASFFGTGGTSLRKIPAWLSLHAKAGELSWASLEQRRGHPVKEGSIPASDVVMVRDTGGLVELALKGQIQPITLEFSSTSEREMWCRHLELAIDVFTPDDERAARDATRDEYRRREIEERRIRNEERRKHLSKDLGMRYTAQALVGHATQSSGQ